MSIYEEFMNFLQKEYGVKKDEINWNLPEGTQKKIKGDWKKEKAAGYKRLHGTGDNPTGTKFPKKK